MIEPHFIIIATGFNCAEYVDRCVESVISQSISNWTLYACSDGCDETSDRLYKYLKYGNQIGIACSKDNRGAAYRRYVFANWHVHEPDSVYMLLGLDDWLEPYALDRIAAEYRAGKWMTYGNWKDQNGVGLPAGFNLEYSDEVHAQRTYRQDKFRATAPNTFLASLYHHIPTDRFIKDGEWIKATTESPLMFGLMEMCGKDRIGVIHDQIYNYQRNRPDSARKRFGDAYQDDIYRRVCNQEKLPLIESL